MEKQIAHGLVEFTVFGNPVPKARPRVVNGHAYTPEKTSIQEQKIALVYRSKCHGFKFEKGVPIKLEADFFVKIPESASKKRKAEMLSGEIRPVGRIGDVDNLLKTVTDAGNGVFYADDAQIVEMTGRRFYSDVPRTEIRIERIGREE